MIPKRRRLGLVINPLAGIGGRVGLKGSDGAETVREAFALGAEPQAQGRAAETLRQLAPLRDSVEIVTYPAEMGADQAVACGFESTVVGTIKSGATTGEDTRRAARELLEMEVELLLFVGGDGTARDIYEAVGESLPVLGVPAGVKMHSSVYATSPRRAGDLVRDYVAGHAPARAMEVMDIDEEQFRAGNVSAKLYGYLSIPFEPKLLQGAKSASRSGAGDLAWLARYVAEQVDDDCHTILGPGTTLRAVAKELGVDKTLLGVDVVLRRALIARDVNELGLLRIVKGNRCRIIVTVIGGQGFILGRGNQQLSPRVIRAVGHENLLVIATVDKLVGLNCPLRVDTGDSELDYELSGYRRVITGYGEESIWQVAV